MAPSSAATRCAVSFTTSSAAWKEAGFEVWMAEEGGGTGSASERVRDVRCAARVVRSISKASRKEDGAACCPAGVVSGPEELSTVRTSLRVMLRCAGASEHICVRLDLFWIKEPSVNSLEFSSRFRSQHTHEMSISSCEVEIP